MFDSADDDDQLVFEQDPDVDMASRASGDSLFEVRSSQTSPDADVDSRESTLDYIDRDDPGFSQRDLDECEGKLDRRKTNVADADVRETFRTQP